MTRPLPEIVVCMKVVPRPEEVRIDPETLTLDRTNVRSIVNPADMNALEAALALKDRYGGRIRILSMGPPNVEPFLRLALALGADGAVLLSDRAFGGADTLATSYTLATAIRKMGPVDLVICGEESSDGATAQVPAGIAEWLGTSQVTYAGELALVDSRWRLRARRELPGGHETLIVPLPATVSIAANCNEPRFIEMDRRAFAATEPVETWDAAALGADPEMIGWAGSATTVAGTHEADRRDRRRERLAGTLDEQVAALAEALRAEFEAARAARPALPEIASGVAAAADAAAAPEPVHAWSQPLRRSERAAAGSVSNGTSWFGRAMLVEEDQTVRTELIARLWKERHGDAEHWGGELRTELGGGHLPFSGDFVLRLETGAESRVTERSAVRSYEQHGLTGELVEVRGVGEPPF